MPTLRDISKAEEDLLRLMRDPSEDFIMAVSLKRGRWFVTHFSQDLLEPPACGEGSTFSEAIRNLKPWGRSC